MYPTDPSTDFLKEIYRDKGYTLIDYPFYPQDEIKEEIKSHDRIMLLGHGYPGGLFGFYDTLIDSRYVDLLKEKICICIWCNADVFVKKYGLKGFYTGMFISEVSEAEMFNIEVSQEKIEYSNNLFSSLVRKQIDSENVLNEVKSSYIGDCPVIKYNNERLYYQK